MSANTGLTVYNYTKYKNVISIIITNNSYNSMLLACNDSDSVSSVVQSFVQYGDLTIMCISPDGKYFAKETYPFVASHAFASINYTMDGVGYYCDGSIVSESELEFNYGTTIDLKPISDSTLAENIIFNGDGSVTINGNTYIVEKNPTIPKNTFNKKIILYIIIVFLIIVIIAALVYIFKMKKQ